MCCAHAWKNTCGSSIWWCSCSDWPSKYPWTDMKKWQKVLRVWGNSGCTGQVLGRSVKHHDLAPHKWDRFHLLEAMPWPTPTSSTWNHPHQPIARFQRIAPVVVPCRANGGFPRLQRNLGVQDAKGRFPSSKCFIKSGSFAYPEVIEDMLIWCWMPVWEVIIMDLFGGYFPYKVGPPR
jgi:hypothetical protein